MAHLYVDVVIFSERKTRKPEERCRQAKKVCQPKGKTEFTPVQGQVQCAADAARQRQAHATLSPEQLQVQLLSLIHI